MQTRSSTRGFTLATATLGVLTVAALVAGCGGGGGGPAVPGAQSPFANQQFAGSFNLAASAKSASSTTQALAAGAVVTGTFRFTVHTDGAAAGTASTSISGSGTIVGRVNDDGSFTLTGTINGDRCEIRGRVHDNQPEQVEVDDDKGGRFRGEAREDEVEDGEFNGVAGNFRGTFSFRDPRTGQTVTGSLTATLDDEGEFEVQFAPNARIEDELEGRFDPTTRRVFAATFDDEDEDADDEDDDEIAISLSGTLNTSGVIQNGVILVDGVQVGTFTAQKVS